MAKRLSYVFDGQDRLSGPLEGIGDGFQEMGDDAKAAADDLKTFDGQISRTEARLKALAQQIARTSDAAQKADLMKKFRAEQRDINQLKKLRGVLGDVGAEVAKAGTKSINILGGAFASLPPQAQAGVVAAGAAIGALLAAAVGAAVTAGVLLGLGGGVLALGIKAAAGSPHVKAAWGQFAERAKEALSGFGQPFEPGMVKAAILLGDALERNAPALKRMGEAMAPLVDKLTPALIAMAERALPGIEKAVIASVPLFEKLAEHAPAIGDAMSRFFTLIAEGGPGAVKFLDVFLRGLTVTITAAGLLISTLSKLFDSSIRMAALMVRSVLTAFDLILAGAAVAFGWIPGIGDKLKTASAKFAAFKNAVNAQLAGIEDEAVTVRVTVVYSGTVGFGRAGTAGVRVPASTSVGGTIGFGPARAHGGPVAAGQAYVVGDAGVPELFVPNTSGMILPRVPAGAPAARSGGGFDAAAMQKTLDRLERSLERAIERGLSRATVVLDGRRIGAVQGRQADLLARGG